MKCVSENFPQPVLYESHMHTPLCKHAVGQPEEYAARALERGLKGIIVTCHNPLPHGISSGVRMAQEQFPEYVALVERARQEWQGRIDVRLGLEADYMPGLEDFLKEQLASAEFNHVLGSVHCMLKEYRKRYDNGDPVKFQETYFTHLADAAETGFFDTLSHPDLVKNIYPHDWDVKRAMPFIEKNLDRIAFAGTAMELNTSGELKTIAEMNPGPQILKAMCERDIPVVIGADAHVPERVADRYEKAMDVLESVGYKEINFFLNRERQTVSIKAARAGLKKNPLESEL
jgi:histidinol-phosphatase (PHP family)